MKGFHVLVMVAHLNEPFQVKRVFWCTIILKPKTSVLLLPSKASRRVREYCSPSHYPPARAIFAALQWLGWWSCWQISAQPWEICNCFLQEEGLASRAPQLCQVLKGAKQHWRPKQSPSKGMWPVHHGAKLLSDDIQVFASGKRSFVCWSSLATQ